MPLLLGFLTNIIPTIVAFFANIAKKITLTSIIVPIQISFLIALYIAKFAFLTFMVTIIVWLYNRIVYVFDLINNLNSNTDFELVIQFLKSIGFIQALNDTFAYFSYILVSFMVLMLTKIFINAMQSIVDEYYKIVVLIQLGLK